MKKRKIITGVSFALGLIIVLCVALMLAKYKINLGEQHELTSQNFYFSSNFLKADKVPPVYEIYGNTVTFQVRNYVDDMRKNDSEIIYTAKATAGNLKKADETVINADTELTLAGGAKNSDSITLTYAFADGEEQKEITVTATSTGVYAKTLTATFIFLKPEGLAYEIKDEVNRNYAEMYIYMGNTAQNVTLSWDEAVLVIDETNDYVFGKVQNKTSPDKSSVEINSITADTTVKIVFFKQDITQDYTCGITKSNGTITIPTSQ